MAATRAHNRRGPVRLWLPCGVHVALTGRVRDREEFCSRTATLSSCSGRPRTRRQPRHSHRARHARSSECEGRNTFDVARHRTMFLPPSTLDTREVWSCNEDGPSLDPMGVLRERWRQSREDPMPTNDPVSPSGEASSSVSRKAGTPERAARGSKKTEARADLDARHERVTRPRRAMGPPLGSTAGPRPAATARRPKSSEVKATDPSTPAKRARKRG